jgi:chorismate mutase
MAVRGIRGAISVEKNSPDKIKQATQALIQEIIMENEIITEDIISVFFSTTSDLNADFPARCAREWGWTSVPMMCTVEIDVPGSIQSIIRVLIHVNTEKLQKDIKHVYLKNAVNLRPDLVSR